MIKKETHPEVFKKRTEAFKKAYANDPNYGFKKGYIPTEKQRATHGMPPLKR
jgi:hypothetical protein